MSRVSIDINYHNVGLLVSDTGETLAKRAANRVQARARRFAPRKTGALAASIRVNKVSGGIVTSYAVYTDLDYGAYQEWGTGPIYPKKPGGVLVFEVGGVTVFAKHTSGVPATHFMRRAGDLTTVLDFITP
jgi:HK97 gp10 family phage protein